MGIKHFWNWFNRNFGRNIKKLKKLQTFETANVSVDNLMIDLNGLFHSSAQKIYEYGNHKPRASFLGKQNHYNIFTAWQFPMLLAIFIDVVYTN